MVADHLIPPDGRDVRCGKCAHLWHVNPAVSEFKPLEPSDEDAFNQLAAALGEPEVTVKPVPRGSNLPVIKRSPLNPKPFKIAAPLLAAVWLILAFITYFPKWKDAPVLGGIYRAVGATPTDGLVFADVEMEREQEGPKTKFILSGSVQNHSSGERFVPTVRVKLLDKDNKTLWGREYAVNTKLEAGKVYPFRITNVETAFAKSVSSIVVDMGNSLQLMVR